MAFTFGKTYFDDKDLQELQDKTVASFSELDKVPLLRGTLLKDISLSAGVSVKVSHLLKRQYNGWFITKKNAASDVFEDNTNNPDQTLFLSLKAVSTVKIDVWVF